MDRPWISLLSDGFFTSGAHPLALLKNFKLRNKIGLDDYEGVRVLLEARLGNVRIPLHIDVGFGDAIVPRTGSRTTCSKKASPVAAGET